jgi:hypothetical protein
MRGREVGVWKLKAVILDAKISILRSVCQRWVFGSEEETWPTY